MISLGKWHILTPLQKLPKNVGDLGQLVVAKGFKKLPKVQKIAKSGHTDLGPSPSLVLPGINVKKIKFPPNWNNKNGRLY